MKPSVVPSFVLFALAASAWGCTGDRLAIPDPVVEADIEPIGPGAPEGEPKDERGSVGSALVSSRKRCDVVVAGGTTAALAAALAAAGEGAVTCLLEPTEWTGGQLTASGVPAIDEAWHKIKNASGAVVLDVSAIARNPANMPPSFAAMLTPTGNPGGCWVSRYCFEPKPFLLDRIFPAETRVKANLTVFRNTVVRRVTGSAGLVKRLVAVRRTPRPGVAWGGYDLLPSKDLGDWYAKTDSARYTKELLTFEGRNGRTPVFIDATEWGEVLALSNAGYLQGVDVTDGSRETNDTCGQSTVFGFVQKLEAEPIAEPDLPEASPSSKAFYSLGTPAGFTDAQQWDRIFRYRRLRGQGNEPHTGEVSLQNWNPGNDFPFGYLFLSKAATRESVVRDEWRGGIDLSVLAAAEAHAYGWHRDFKERGVPSGRHVKLERTVLGTGHGLSKLPYVRDTRRSVGLGGFVLTMADLTGDPVSKTAKRFRDRVALGAYPADVHPLASCRYPAHVKEYDVLPYYVPFRALTNETYRNLLVAGKTMAQSFMANAATRLHPIEWSTGTAAGVSAAMMAESGLSTAELLERVVELQSRVRARTPTEWTIDGRAFPEAAETTPM